MLRAIDENTITDAAIERPTQGNLAAFSRIQLRNNGTVPGERYVHNDVGPPLDVNQFAPMLRLLPSIRS